jgi:hypothetical protein
MRPGTNAQRRQRYSLAKPSLTDVSICWPRSCDCAPFSCCFLCEKVPWCDVCDVMPALTGEIVILSHENSTHTLLITPSHPSHPSTPSLSSPQPAQDAGKDDSYVGIHHIHSDVRFLPTRARSLVHAPSFLFPSLSSAHARTYIHTLQQSPCACRRISSSICSPHQRADRHRRISPHHISAPPTPLNSPTAHSLNCVLPITHATATSA